MYSGRFNTNSCQSPNCGKVLTASNSLSQGATFRGLHGGKTRRNMRGGAVDYPTQFSEVLPVDMHSGARITSLDNAFAQLPSFAGKYGMSGGKRSRRSSRKHARKQQRGGVAAVNAPPMILTPQEEPAAFLNPQWYTENQVVPSFKGPDNSYVQKAGKRSRKEAKKSKRSRRNNRNSRR